MSASFTTPPPDGAASAQAGAATPVMPEAGTDPAAARTEQASLRRRAYARAAGRSSAPSSRRFADRRV